MRIFFTKVFSFFFFLAAWLFVYSCANIVPPTGGKADHTPPKLLSMTPKDSLLNSKVKKIVLHFDKFVEVNDLAKNMTISPLLDIPPSVIAYGKRIEIKLVDSLLEENTTYKLSLGKAITDNREKTPYQGFTYTFSTGSFFDSLQLAGQVNDALTGSKDTGISILLYPENFNDSLLTYKKPLYITNVDAQGNFKFTSLPARKFKIYALSDLDGNRVWSPEEEKLGFIDSIVLPYAPNDSLMKPIAIRTSLIERELPKKAEGKKDSLAVLSKQYVGRVFSKDKNATAYKVEVDTITKDKGTLDLTKPIKIRLNAVVGQIDTSKLFLSYSNKSGIESEATSKLTSDSVSLLLRSNWIPETTYTLRLVKGWAKDTAGLELPPDKLKFITKSLSDYSNVQIHFPDSFVQSNFRLVLTLEKDTIANQVITDSLISFQQLQPGNYKLAIINDANGNGRWDAGNLYKKTQPEYITHNEATIVLKAGWQQEVDFKTAKEGASGTGAARKKAEMAEDKKTRF